MRLTPTRIALVIAAYGILAAILLALFVDL
jgi:hypothetical protein